MTNDFMSLEEYVGTHENTPALYLPCARFTDVAFIIDVAKTIGDGLPDQTSVRFEREETRERTRKLLNTTPESARILRQRVYSTAVIETVLNEEFGLHIPRMTTHGLAAYLLARSSGYEGANVGELPHETKRLLPLKPRRPLRDVVKYANTRFAHELGARHETVLEAHDRIIYDAITSGHVPLEDVRIVPGGELTKRS